MHQLPIYDIWRLLNRPRHEAEAEIRASCRSVYLGDHEALTRILGRYKMYVDTRDIGISSHLMMEGYWETWVTEAMMRMLRRGAIVADVGANLGYFTLLMADLAGSEGRVLSFEPNPELARRLRKSIDINGFAGFTDFYQMGLGGEAGWAEMDVEQHQPGGGRTVPVQELEGWPSSVKEMLSSETEQGSEATAEGQRSEDTPPSPDAIPIRRFDDIPHARSVEFMKIDVEGFEPHVWAGMTGRLENYDLPLTIFMEFTISRFADARGFLDEILSWGFSLEIITFLEGVCPITPDELFATSHSVDHMLVFRREARPTVAVVETATEAGENFATSEAREQSEDEVLRSEIGHDDIVEDDEMPLIEDDRPD